MTPDQESNEESEEPEEVDVEDLIDQHPGEPPEIVDMRADLEDAGIPVDDHIGNPEYESDQLESDPEESPETDAEQENESIPEQLEDKEVDSKSENESEQPREDESEQDPEFQFVTPEGEPVPHHVPPGLEDLEDSIDKLYEEQENPEDELENDSEQEPENVPEQPPEKISAEENESMPDQTPEFITGEEPELIPELDSEATPEITPELIGEEEEKEATPERIWKKKRFKAKDLELITNPDELGKAPAYTDSEWYKAALKEAERSSEKSEGTPEKRQKPEEKKKKRKIKAKDLEVITDPEELGKAPAYTDSKYYEVVLKEAEKPSEESVGTPEKKLKPEEKKKKKKINAKDLEVITNPEELGKAPAFTDSKYYGAVLKEAEKTSEESEGTPEKKQKPVEKKKRINAKNMELVPTRDGIPDYSRWMYYKDYHQDEDEKSNEKSEQKPEKKEKPVEKKKEVEIEELELISEPINEGDEKEAFVYESESKDSSDSQNIVKAESQESQANLTGNSPEEAQGKDTKSDKSQSQKQSQPKESQQDIIPEREKALMNRYRQETGKRPIYNKQKTKGFLLWLKKLEQKNRQENNLRKEKETWDSLLEKWIKESEISKKIKEELIDILKKFKDFRGDYLKLVNSLKKKELTQKEIEEIEGLVKELESITVIQSKLFRNLKAFRSLYIQHYRWHMYLILKEREKFINHIARKLQYLKNNKRAPYIKSWKEILRQNLDKNSTLSLNQKSKIATIIRKNKLIEDDIKELVLILKKLPIEELISLLGREFQKHSENYIKWGWDFYEYIKNDMLTTYIKKNEFVNNIAYSNKTLGKIVKKCLEFHIEIKNLGEYKARTSKLKLVCEKCNHGSEIDWYKTGNNILKATWKGCPICISKDKLINYFSHLKERARQKGIEIISEIKELQNSRSRIKLICLNPDCLYGQKEEWSRRAGSIMESRFHGCPKCNTSRKGIKTKQEYFRELGDIAISKGGHILSDKYTNSKRSYIFECKHGHIFRRFPQELKRGYWCKQCIKEMKLKEMQEVAKKNDGRLISNEYINALTPLIWECNKCFYEGIPFRWSARAADIKNGTWCPKCAGKFKYSIDDMKKFAKSKNGDCLSCEYKNMKSSLLWKCGDCGNEWFASPTSIIHQGTWCPRCGSSGISERICRKFFEALFNSKFPTISNLEWLVNEDGNRMHLDGYSKKLRLAFEYNGIQHYVYNKHFYRNKEEFEIRKRDDKRKKELCIKNNVILIVIPYFVSFDEMEDYIRTQCKMRGIHMSETEDRIDWNDFNITPPNMIQEMRMAAKKIGIKRYGFPGKCLSNDYFGRLIHLKWECGDPSCRHQWWATPNNVINHQRWCPRCAGKKYSIEDMHLLAAEKLNGGKCLSDEYEGAKVHLKWECGVCGNIWSATPDNISRDKGCPNWRKH
ncbi:MAG: hypothetical protein ACFFE4_04410 [Candidatus Thorarchaeota archaeon]